MRKVKILKKLYDEAYPIIVHQKILTLTEIFQNI